MKNLWNNFKQKINLVKDLGYIGSSNIFGILITSSFWFYLANELKVEEFGEIQYYLGIAGIAYYASLISTSNTITVYAAKKIKINSTLFFISIIASFVSLLAIFVMIQKIDVGILVIGYIINELSLSYLLGKKLYSKYSKNILIQKISSIIFGFSFYYLFGVEGIIFGLALSYIHFIWIIYKGFKESKISFSSLKPYKDFITNNYLEGLVNGFRAHIDKIVISPMIGFVVLGNYSLAIQLFTVLIMPSEIVLKYIIPQDASGISKIELKKIIVLISIGIMIFGIVVLPVFITNFFPKYLDAIEAIKILSISVIPTTIGYIFVSKLLSLEKSRFILYGRMISITIIILSLVILTKPFGITGVATSYVLSTTSQTLFFIFVYKKFIVKN